jgi:hypothetical protein
MALVSLPLLKFVRPPCCYYRFRKLRRMSLRLKMTIFWDDVPCSLAEVYWRFRGAYCLHHLFAAVRTWNLTEFEVVFRGVTSIRNRIKLVLQFYSWIVQTGRQFYTRSWYAHVWRANNNAQVRAIIDTRTLVLLCDTVLKWKYAVCITNLIRPPWCSSECKHSFFFVDQH